MTLLQQIDEAIYRLLGAGPRIRRDNLIICYSPMVKRFILDEMNKKVIFSHNPFASGMTNFNGVEVNEFWPYNEIVVYDKEQACYYPEHFLVKISVDKKAKNNQP